MVLPASDGISRVPPYSGSTQEGTKFQTTGFLPSLTDLSRSLHSTPFLCNSMLSVLQPQEASLLVWAIPVSLAATQGIAFAFSSSGYLDVSVPRVCLQYPMYSGKDTVPLRTVGFPIRKSPDQSLLTAPRSISVLVPSFIGS